MINHHQLKYDLQIAQNNIRQLEKARQKIKTISSTLTYTSTEHLNPVAIIDCHIKHTNQFTIQLGCDYFAQIRAEQVFKIINHRIKQQNNKIEQIKSVISQMQNNTRSQFDDGIYSKNVIVNEQDGSTKSQIVRVTKLDDGEQLFTIEEFQQPTTAEPKQQIVAQPQKYKHQQIEEKPEEEEQDIKDSSEQQPEQMDFMQSARQNQVDQLEEVQEQEEQTVKQQIKSKQQIKDNCQKQQTSTPNQLPSTSSNSQNKINTKQPIHIAQPLPQKISKFKLQKMKQKLEKQK